MSTLAERVAARFKAGGADQDREVLEPGAFFGELSERVKHILEKAHLKPVNEAFAKDGVHGFISFEKHMDSEQAKRDAEKAAKLLERSGLQTKIQHQGMGKFQVKITDPQSKQAASDDDDFGEKDDAERQEFIEAEAKMQKAFIDWIDDVIQKGQAAKKELQHSAVNDPGRACSAFVGTVVRVRGEDWHDFYY